MKNTAIEIGSRCLAVFLLLLLAGCSAEPASGRPERILSLSTAATHILTELGAPPAAIDEYGRIAAGENPPPVIGKGSAVSQEKVAELGIDCAVIWYYQNDAAKRFRESGIRVVSVPPPRLSNCPELILRLGELTGRMEKARELAEVFRRKLARLSDARGDAPRRVYFELYSSGKAAADESYLGDLLRAAGGRSIQRKSGLVSTEYVAEAAPEVIFFVENFGSAEEIAARPGFASTPAVRNGRIYPVPRRLTVEGLAPLEAIAYLNDKMR